LIDRQRLKTVVKIALPIMGGMLSANLFSVVDTVMVGRLDKASLAAVGLAGFLVGLPLALVTGFGLATQAIGARRIGEGKPEQAGKAVDAGLLLSFAIGAPFGLLFALISEGLLSLLSPDPNVIAIATPYTWALLASLPATAIASSIRGYWSGARAMKHYTWTIVVTHAANILLNYALIFGELGAPRLEALGAGIGSALASWLGAGLCFVMAMRQDRGSGFLSAWPGRGLLKSFLNLSLPAGGRTMSRSIGGLALTAIMGMVGTAELAVSSVLIRVVMLTVLPAMGLGMACATMVGQALGRGQPDDAERWGWDVVKVGLVVMAVLGLPFALAPEAVMRFFVTDPDLIALGSGPVLISGLNRPLAAAFILIFALNGAGDNRRATLASVLLHWGFFLPSVWVAMIWLEWPFVSVFFLITAHIALQFLVFGTLWRRGRWRHIKV